MYLNKSELSIVSCETNDSKKLGLSLASCSSCCSTEDFTECFRGFSHRFQTWFSLLAWSIRICPKLYCCHLTWKWMTCEQFYFLECACMCVCAPSLGDTMFRWVLECISGWLLASYQCECLLNIVFVIPETAESWLHVDDENKFWKTLDSLMFSLTESELSIKSLNRSSLSLNDGETFLWFCIMPVYVLWIPRALTMILVHTTQWHKWIPDHGVMGETSIST